MPGRAFSHTRWAGTGQQPLPAIPNRRVAGPTAVVERLAGPAVDGPVLLGNDIVQEGQEIDFRALPDGRRLAAARPSGARRAAGPRAGPAGGSGCPSGRSDTAAGRSAGGSVQPSRGRWSGPDHRQRRLGGCGRGPSGGGRLRGPTGSGGGCTAGRSSPGPPVPRPDCASAWCNCSCKSSGSKELRSVTIFHPFPFAEARISVMRTTVQGINGVVLVGPPKKQ